MRIAWFPVVLFVYLATGCFNAFSQKIAFKKISPPTNYPFSLISGMAQDSSGFLWFTSGPVLYRYDGYEYTTYTNDPGDTNSIFSNGLECILIDKEGLIWTGDIYTGLNILDPKTGKFTHFRHNADHPEGLPDDHISALAEDKDGNIWIGTTSGIVIYSKKTKTFTHYRHDPKNAESLSSNDIITIYKDREGIMWVGCGGAFRTGGKDRSEGGLNKFDAATGTFIHYLHDPKDNQTLSSNLVQTIFEDSRGVFWVGTVGENGLQTLNRKTGKFTRYIYDPKNPTKLSRLPINDNVIFADDHIPFITEDITGAIWIGSYENGLSRYDPETKTVARYGVSNDADSLHESGFWSIFQTKDGMLWIGSWQGGNFNFYKIDPAPNELSVEILNTSFDSFLEDTDVIYAGAYPGLAVLDKNKKVLRRYDGQREEVSRTDTLSDRFIFKIIKDRAGIIWLGTDIGGLNSFDPGSEKFRNYRYNPADKNSIDTGMIVALHEDRFGTFWVGVTSGLNIMDRKTGSFRHIRHDAQNPQSLSSNEISSIFEDSNGDLWIGTGKKGGLNKLVRDNYSFEHFLENNSIEDLFEDSRGILWIATDNGLYSKERKSDKFIRYEDYNFRSDPLYVEDILEDDFHNLWLISLAGIHIIDSNRSNSVFYPLTQNWSVGTSPYLPGIKLSSGEILYGSSRGYFHFYPHELLNTSAAPQIVVTDFHYTDKAKNNFPLLLSDVITLPYDQNTFSMKFAGINFNNPANNQHIYKLDGYDDDWRKAGSERTAYFYNVPPGNYTLRIAASNYQGVWTEKSFKITITPPWWSTWWFRSIAVLSILGILYGLIRWRTHQKFRRQLEQAERQKQLADLRHQTSELEIHALRAQMNPHFIFNSLNSINRFILQNNKNQASEYLTKFSKLVRLVFHNAQSSLITLESELEALDIYLELEMLRFDNHFEYRINLHDDVDASALLVPPLIIQPYAENAIWHGLMHKEDDGHLSIDISLEDEMVVCRIKDDGIGRKKSAEIKSGSPATHKSMGMRITSDRIALLHQQNLVNNAILVKDLVLPDGCAGGTEVIVKLPVKYD